MISISENFLIESEWFLQNKIGPSPRQDICICVVVNNQVNNLGMSEPLPHVGVFSPYSRTGI